MMDALGMLAELVAIPSVTDTPGEAQAIAWLERLLQARGIRPERVGDASRPNLVAHLPGTCPAAKPLVLLSHIDVAPVAGQAWTHPPFGAEIADGRLYGRGTLDTKQLTIMELMAFLRLRAMGGTRRDVFLVATVDEEKGSAFGAERVARECPSLFGDVIAISEGGGFPLSIGGKAYLTMTVGEKASCRIRLQACGQSGHAGAPGEEQAVVRLTRAVACVLDGVAALANQGETYRAMARRIGATPDNALACELLAYAGQCGVAVRPFQIGERVNVLPAEAAITLELRPLPGTTRADVEGWLAQWLQCENVTFAIESFQPGILCQPEHPLGRRVAALAAEAAARHGMAAEILPMLALGRTDGRFFGGGSSVFGFSPLGMADAFDAILPLVHGVDEQVSIGGFQFGCAVLTDMVTQLAMEVEWDG